jgi:uncharacterized repeat protein (TIGR01451 family)
MMRALASRWAAFLFGCVLLLANLPARADTAISLFQSFRGNLNFTGTEETLRTKDNRYPCTLVNNSYGIYAYLGGLPKGATVKSAQLYWAGSGTSPDYTVTFDGVSITAPTNRQYKATASANNTTYTYFSGAADVTSQVSKKGNGYYYFSGLKVNTGEPWCSVQGVVGGFSLAVIYSHPDEPFRMVNLYEGFKDFRDTSLTISLSGFNVPDPLPSASTGRVGHITWEGDVTLSQGGEDLLFNGIPMVDTMNPQGNQFNSQSNVTGDKASYGIDFDIYTLKSPTIKAGQSTASTTYKSGQDLVLLSAEIVAMPYSAIADLSLSMTRTGDLTVGSATDYTLTVTNGGVDAEIGPVTVVDTLPAGLKLISAGGTKWTCTDAAGAKGTIIVTCTQAGPIAANARMTPLTISVTPTGLGNYTNTATVSGNTGDKNLTNNTASNTGGAVDNGSAALVFTKEPCTVGQPIVISAQDAGCHKFIGPVTAASTATIYITAVEGAQKAGAVDKKASTLPIDLKASCLPYSNVSASYAGKTLDCKGTWVNAVPVAFEANQPSAALSFAYADVGRVSLSMRYEGAVMAAVDFISKPADIRFQNVFRAADKVPDYEGDYEKEGWAKDERYAFAKAGEQFVMRLGALMADGNYAPSFGKEPTALKGVLPDDQIDLDMQMDLFAVNLNAMTATTPPMPTRVPIADKDDVVRGAFVFDQGFTLNGTGNMEATVRWYEAGVFAATPFLTDYLGTGKIGGPPPQADIDLDATKRLVSSTRVIGRFYPDHFETTAVAPIGCPAAVNCPLVNPDPAKTPSFPVSGAVYAEQPFSFSVEAFGLPRDGRPSILSLFRNLGARPIKVTAVASPDGEKDANGTFGVSTEKDKRLPIDPDVGVYPDLTAIATHQLGTPYSAATQATRANAANWIGPTLIYLRASLADTYVTGGTPTKPTTAGLVVNSRVPANAAPGTRYEDGLLVLSGRLFVPNVFGSDLLRLPVPLTAQYWTGSTWATSDGDNTSIVAASLVPKTCMKFFAADGKSGACKANPLTPAVALPLQIAAGKTVLHLKAPTRGTVGTVDFSADNGFDKDVARSWLPSTIGRTTFGLYRSPLIYLREVY